MNDSPQAARDYRGTVFLPQTGFPMRGDLPKREPDMLARWARLKLWERLRAQSKGRESFVLHDGPPYANGNLHIGHALNKILKDVINRAAQMAGFDANYVPGWDCHGLPIEWKVEEEYRNKGRDKDAVPVLDFRAECRAYAEHWLEVQREEFIRLGVAGDWADRYATMDFASEAAIAAEIGKFLMNGSLYRGLRPVMWSPVEKTALAEAEIEYHDHVSPTLWARFPIVSGPQAGASVVIWTTTPWTIPGNRAVAYGPDIEYRLYEMPNGQPVNAVLTEIESGKHVIEGPPNRWHMKPGERFIVAGDINTLTRLRDDFGLDLMSEAHQPLARFKGAELAGAIAAHPLRGHGYEFDVPLLPGDFVTTEAGTGFVHIAPGHGEDDFNLGRAHNLPIPETVNDDGTFTHEAPGFEGLHVFKAHDAVYAACSAAGTLVAKGKLTHSYPHSWRSKKPVIFRATPQWFIAMDDANAIRAKSLDAIAKTHFVPDAGRNRIGSMVAARPDWCISRQRAWGVPIPVFVDRRTGEPLRDPAIMDRIVAAFTAEGADAWYKPGAAARFLGDGRDPAAYEQVMDIVDVWFESGSTHAFVLPPRGLPFPADLYLEGSDQHRGWFHSSLLESVGTNGVAPFKAVLTHGFVLDEQGRKMSKSMGNVTAPQDVMKQYGADILRLWVMNSDTALDLRIGPEILKQQAELYRRIRNTLRWLLGNLDGFSEDEIVPYGELPELERWLLHRLTELDAKIRRAVETHDWTGVYPEIHQFCATDLSAFYFDIRKDSLYCDAPDASRRRSARTVLDILHRCLCAWFAPVLVFTAEEAWLARFPDEGGSVHLLDFPFVPEGWKDQALAAKWARLRELRRAVTGALERARVAQEIGSSLQAAPVLHVAPEDASLLSSDLWAELCITSGFALSSDVAPEGAFVADGVADAAAVFRPAPGLKCDRCWRVLPEVGECSSHPTLCRRCDAVVEAL
ncbi:MAG: isoleucine--tRNA ligase [Roseomonas sp.]|nr:isoleucine--tRNA ligase [Roseomonas sp.]MCA3329158.1 isoleucine--tRNA ligase [Roseomonas sp.]MCA3332072.1 isoleucine--tRNA ligase [Roseomonas sp.]MCA3334720.1 isoleucine--tRNA ligase [Roseomonas sp.]MCA3347070.1 isoleucine--tRNA ligase [Roseomonas sp.]